MSNSRAATQHGLIPLEIIERRIYFIRTHKVMLDSDLAELYGVTTKRLNEQVKRNIDRFPTDFMLQLHREESDRLRSQFATSKHGRGGRRYQPYVFTEHGALMLASVLNSEKAIQASIQIVPERGKFHLHAARRNDAGESGQGRRRERHAWREPPAAEWRLTIGGHPGGAEVGSEFNFEVGSRSMRLLCFCPFLAALALMLQFRSKKCESADAPVSRFLGLFGRASGVP